MREEVRKKKREEKKVKRKKKRKVFLKIVLWLFIIGILIVMAGGAYAYSKYKPLYDELQQQADKKVAMINEGTFKDKTETVIYDKNGNVMRELAIHDYYYINEKDIKPKIKEAVIAIEDERFYDHNGYDKKAIARAFYHLVKNKGEITQGGSTITQQLVKLQFLTLEKSYKRKIEEVLIARDIEKMYSKEEILEFYLNNVNYGNGAYGIETASITYFNKPSQELTLSEIAFLTAIPNNPSLYDPVRKMENTLKRRDLILSKMKELLYITESEYKEAKSQQIVLNMPKSKTEPESYDVSFAISSATKLLMEKEGFEFKYSFKDNEERIQYDESYNERFVEINKKIRNGGYRIYTTIDPKQQEMLQKSINEGLSDLTMKDKDTGIYKTQGASVTIDNQTGDVVAIVGGRTQEDVDNTFNRAFLSARQPGSAIKPLIVYTPAFERGMISSTVMRDKPIEDGPRNAGRNYRGNMTLREAVERSTNTIAYQIMEKLHPKTVLPYLEDMKFSSLVPEDNHLSIALGGFTYGTNPLEMAGAYSTLARNGDFIQPTGIEKIVDVTNTVIYENTHKKEQIYDSGASYLMTDVMKGVLTSPYGTGKGFALSDHISAGKSGTTNDYKDLWFAGYTPYYTTVVWVGNDVPSKIKNYQYAKSIWNDYMEKIHKGLPDKDFDMPKGISYKFVHPNTGEVDAYDNHGWWKKELVPDSYYKMKQKEQIEAERKRLEEQRIAEEKRKKEEERKRKERADALERYGITEEEEMEREAVAENALNLMSNSHIYSKDDVSYVEKLIKDTSKAIQEVVIREVRNSLNERYTHEANRLQQERKEVESRKPIQEEPIEVGVEVEEESEQESVSTPIPVEPSQPVEEVPSPTEPPTSQEENPETPPTTDSAD